MKTPEKYEKEEIRRYLTNSGAWHFSPQNAGFGVSGVPDVVFCWRGRFGGIEVKREGKGPTPQQRLRLAEIERAGGWPLWGTAQKVIPELRRLMEGTKDF